MVETLGLLTFSILLLGTLTRVVEILLSDGTVQKEDGVKCLYE